MPMSVLAWIFAASIAGGALSVLAAAAFALTARSAWISCASPVTTSTSDTTTTRLQNSPFSPALNLPDGM